MVCFVYALGQAETFLLAEAGLSRAGTRATTDTTTTRHDTTRAPLLCHGQTAAVVDEMGGSVAKIVLMFQLPLDPHD